MIGPTNDPTTGATTGATSAPTASPTDVRARASLRATVPWLLLGAAWLAVVAGGMHRLWRYSSDPGPGAAAPAEWPAASRIGRAPGRATLVMFAHPHCPCSRASVGELGWLMAHYGPQLDAHVLVLRAPGTAPGWEEGDIGRLAADVPGVRVEIDAGGVEAARFGAKTSGQVLLYDAGGRLLFSGGITGGRGHPGDNLGRARVVSLLTTGTADRADSPVFGCALEDSKP
ncbi:MAG TPA: RedB protein [Myxococcota bacterium]|jgi:hypothetical protein|nr:RedB protein [Myxococcota bacterium]